MHGDSQSKHDALRQAMFLLRAKKLCAGHAYTCFLDEESYEVVPTGLRRKLDPPFDKPGLLVNSSLCYRPRGDLPEDLVRRAVPTDGFVHDQPLAWIEDPGTRIWVPYWVRGEWARALERLQPGEPAPSDLDPPMLRTLETANILVAPGYAEARRAQWDEKCRSARIQFWATGYVVMRDLVPALHVGAVQRYYRALVAAGHLPLGDSQVPARYGLHSELLGRFFHPQFAGLVSRLAGEPVKPSYLYFASYQPGADLPRHTDREQCEFSISLLADYTPDPGGPCGWPLFLEHPRTPGVVHVADLGIGDALFYRGRELAHYRKPLPAGHGSTSLFFHYVRADFAGGLW